MLLVLLATVLALLLLVVMFDAAGTVGYCPGIAAVSCHV